jgi:hypothetical protein
MPCAHGMKALKPLRRTHPTDAKTGLHLWRAVTASLAQVEAQLAVARQLRRHDLWHNSGQLPIPPICTQHLDRPLPPHDAYINLSLNTQAPGTSMSVQLEACTNPAKASSPARVRHAV